MSRTAARDTTVCLIYKWLLTGSYEDWRETFDAFFQDANIDENDFPYVEGALYKVAEKAYMLEKTIADISDRWRVERMGKAELSILILSACEICYLNIAPGVSINEAVEISKKYGRDEAPRFVNAMLSTLVKRLKDEDYIASMEKLGEEAEAAGEKLKIFAESAYSEIADEDKDEVDAENRVIESLDALSEE